MKYFYLRNKHKFPVACVASLLDKKTVRFAVATHNPLDEYDKHRAQEIASARLANGKNESIRISKGIKIKILNRIIKAEGVEAYPQRTREAAKLWLKNHEPIN